MAKCLNINRVFHSSKTFNQLTLVDVMCPVCRGIFIEPVTLPCRHGLCLKCFERAMDETSLTCPMCRKRVGGWLRTATKVGKIVNDQLWNYIKARFPDQVQKKLKGEDDGVEEQVVTASTPKVQLSSPGEIRREYELQMTRLDEEARRREEEERKASEELILKLSEEERELQERLLEQAKADEEIARRMFEQEMARLREEKEEAERQRRDQEMARRLEEEARLQLEMEKAQELEDEKIARQLQEEDAKRSSKSSTTDKANKTEEPSPVFPRTPVSTVKGPMDSFVSFNRASKLEPSTAALPEKEASVSNVEKVRSSSNLSCSSHDSINQEMHHFKPIKVMPRTPPKRLPDGQVVEPKLIRSTPRNLNKILELETPKSKPVVRLHQLRLLQQGKRTSLPASSAFKDLLSAKNEPVRTMISPESAMVASRQSMRPDEDSTSFGLFEVPDVTTPPLSPLPAVTSENPLASASTPDDIPAAPPAYDADLFYNPEMPVCIDYCQPEKQTCNITEEDACIEYETEADASLGYSTTVTDEACCSSSTTSWSSSSSSSSKINNNNNNDTATTSTEDEEQSEVQKMTVKDMHNITSAQQPTSHNTAVAVSNHSAATDDVTSANCNCSVRVTVRLNKLHFELLRLQEQQITDAVFARQLQEEWHKEDRLINRSRSSHNPYPLRNGTRKSTKHCYASKTTPTRRKSGKIGKRRTLQNQKTIKEAFARTNAINK